MDTLVTAINKRLKTILEHNQNSLVKDAMQYSLLAGGKRIRPLMMLEVIRSYDKEYMPYLDVACAIEMVHTYSLIHDDLPGMDNDDLRRGKLTCHKQFNEATAILAGDGLLNEAINVIIKSSLEANLKISCMETLFQASGIDGMIYGQQLDIEAEENPVSLEQLDVIHTYKTGALISASLQLGALIANKADQDVWKKIGYKIGLAFQIQDDVLDVISDSQTLGKNIGSDKQNHKSTYVTLMKVEEASKLVDTLFNEAMELLYSLRINHGLVLGIIEMLKKRVK